MNSILGNRHLRSLRVKRRTRPGHVPGSLVTDPDAAPTTIYLLGYGAYSMSPAFIPAIKELAGHLTEKNAKLILNRALPMKTARQITRFMDQQLQNLAPDLAILETA